MKILFEKYKALFLGGVALCIGIFLFISEPKNETVSGVTGGPSIPPAVKSDEGQAEGEVKETFAAARIYIDVKGAVVQPGMYSMKEGDRIFDAIGAAGGLTEHADEKRVNFAQKLFDEMVVFIPAEGEETEELNLPAPQPSSGPETGEGKVDINEADAVQLETLPGIGPAKAKAIIDYREKNGSFKQIEDIQNVSGIGAKSFEKLQDSIMVR